MPYENKERTIWDNSATVRTHFSVWRRISVIERLISIINEKQQTLGLFKSNRNELALSFSTLEIV